MNYQDIYQSWQDNPEAFWKKAARGIDWYKAPTQIFSPDDGVYGRWFVDGECNTCFNAVDRHVLAGHGDRVAIIYDSPVTGQCLKITYAELQTEVSAIAGFMQQQGVVAGDRVIIYMPMIPQAVMAMLACARIGAVHSLVFGGFASKELATRIDDAKPKMVISASCGIEPSWNVAYKPLLDAAIELAGHKPEACLILQRPEQQAEMVVGRDHDYQESIAQIKADGAQADCVRLKAIDPLYILYTSGTTGQPKGVVRDNGGHMVALHWTMEHIYGVKSGEVYWAASDVGWVVGHSYICYAPLLAGCTTVIYEGKPIGTPDAGAFWRVIEQHKVSILFTAPTAFRAVKREDPQGDLVKQYDLSHFRALFLAGERADPDTVRWAEEKLRRPVIDHWWQTETSWAIAGNPMGIELLPIKQGSPGVAMPGYDLCVLDDDGAEVPPGELGNLAVKLPLPPGCLPNLWQAEERFRNSYLVQFSGYYATSDAGYLDEDGYVYIMSRTDDIINVAGHRLSTGAIEEVIASHADVAECAVVGVADALKGQLPVGFYILNSGAERTAAEVEAELVEMVRTQIGPVAVFKTAIMIERLPKTRSGKILRGTIQKIADRVDWKMPAAIDDPEILNEITEALQARGFAKGA